MTVSPKKAFLFWIGRRCHQQQPIILCTGYPLQVLTTLRFVPGFPLLSGIASALGNIPTPTVDSLPFKLLLIHHSTFFFTRILKGSINFENVYLERRKHWSRQPGQVNDRSNNEYCRAIITCMFDHRLTKFLSYLI